MNIHKISLFALVILVTASLFSGCVSLRPTPTPTALPPVRITVPSTFPPTPVPSVTASPTPQMPSPTPPDPAKDAVYAFFSALSAGDYKAAANLYSNFSLMVGEVTRGEAAADLKELALIGRVPSSGVVLESRSFDNRTSLVHVQYTTGKPGEGAVKEGVTVTPTTAIVAPSPTVTLASGSVDRTRQAEMVATNDARPAPTPASAAVTPAAPSASAALPAAVDEWWPVRLENGQWRINRSKLIDFQTLDVPAQTTAGLTIQPRQVTRYSDHLSLILLVQNQTDDAIVLGQSNEIMATFLFGDTAVEAENTRFIFASLRSYPDTAVDLKGLYETFPDGVIIRRWKNLKVKPWFEFRFK